MRDIPLINLLYTYLLIVFFIVLAAWRRLGIAREMFFSSLQGSLQLVLIGFLITWIFKVENAWIVAGVLFAMCATATFVAGRRIRQHGKLSSLLALAIYSTTYLTLGLLVLFGSIEWTGKFIIPIGGMLIGQTMNCCSLFMERLFSDLKSSRLWVESNLALGAKPHQAIQRFVAKTLKAISIPIIDMLKTLGLIYLPGMMAGLIVGGADPVVAVKYQLVVIFMLTFAFGFSSTLLAVSIHLFIFNRNHQFKPFDSPPGV